MATHASTCLADADPDGVRGFTDASTFNAIGRDDFGHTGYTTSTADGRLTIG